MEAKRRKEMRRVDDTKRGKDTGTPQRSTRLVFSYKGNIIKLVSSQTIDMIPPPTDPMVPSRKESGVWFEVKDARNKTLFRRVSYNPIQQYVEVLSGDPERPFTQVKMDKPAGTFVVIVPEIKDAKNISVFSSPAGKKIIEPAKEIARFPLKRTMKRKGG
jgi:hypothetical protein